MAYNSNKLEILDNYAVVNGNDCDVWGNNCVVNGDRAKVYGDDCIINGDYCSIYGHKSIINGNNNQFYVDRFADHGYNNRFVMCTGVDQTPFNNALVGLAGPTRIIQQDRLPCTFTRSQSIVDTRQPTTVAGPIGPIGPIGPVGPIGLIEPFGPVGDPRTLPTKSKQIEPVRHTETLPEPIVPDEPCNEDDACAVCMSNKKCCAAVPCGHNAVCGSCSRELQKSKKECVICRKPVTQYLRIYQV